MLEPYYKRNGITLYLGDSAEVIPQLGIENKIDLVFTDPPYGKLTGHKIETDIDWLKVSKMLYDTLKKDGWLITFGDLTAKGSFEYFLEFHKLFGKLYKHITWDKLTPSGFSNTYLNITEQIFLYRKGNGFFDKNVKEDFFKSWSYDKLGRRSFETLIKYFRELVNITNSKEKLLDCIKRLDGDNSIYTLDTARNDEWHYKTKGCGKHITSYVTIKDGYTPSTLIRAVPENKKTRGKNSVNKKHPTVKPEEVIRPFILRHCHEGGIVLDAFLGTGSTALACAKIDRECIGIELHKEYIDIAVEYLELFFNKK